MEAIDSAYSALLWASVAFMSLLSCAWLLRAIIGPRFTDRVVSINVICTKTMVIIAILSFLLGESNLLDISVVYAMIGFLAVVVLSKCYILPHHASPGGLEYDPETSRFRHEGESR